MAMEINPSNIIEAMYLKIKRDKNDFRLSKSQFETLFGIDVSFYYKYDLLDWLYDTYVGIEYDKCFAAWNCISGIKTLIFSAPNSNSYENEYSQLYAYLNIINLNRSQIKNKQYFRECMFKTFLFCRPAPEDVVNGTKLSSKGILYYHGMKIDNMVQDILKLSNDNLQFETSKLAQNNIMLELAYKYLTGKELFLPQYLNMDAYAYYFFNPLDYINLYQYDKRTFFELMDNCVVGKMSFMKKAFIYNYNLFIVDNVEKILELKEHLVNFNKVKDILYFSVATVRNETIRKVKYGYCMLPE